MSDPKTDPVRAAALVLLGAPADVGAFLDLADALEASGRKGQASKAFQALGEAASALGSVGLAAACVRWLLDQKQDKPAEKLLGLVARTHSKGSKVVATGCGTTIPPPLPPPADDESAATKVSDDTGKAADEAIAAAVAAARKRAPSVLASTPLVSVLDAADLKELVGLLRQRRIAAGEVVIDVGEPATALYWIARGDVEVSRGEVRLGELHGNAFFGEIALVGGTTRTARVTARAPTWLLEIPAAAVETLAGRAPKLARVLASHARARLLANVMRTSELFARLGDDERASLLPLFETQLVQPGDKLIAIGAENDKLFVVASGRCEVRESGAAVAILEPGDGIGEVSLLARKPATADVIALEPTVVLSLSRDTFDQVAVKHPTLLAEVYRMLVERERENRAIVHDASDLVL